MEPRALETSWIDMSVVNGKHMRGSSILYELNEEGFDLRSGFGEDPFLCPNEHTGLTR